MVALALLCNGAGSSITMVLLMSGSCRRLRRLACTVPRITAMLRCGVDRTNRRGTAWSKLRALSFTQQATRDGPSTISSKTCGSPTLGFSQTSTSCLTAAGPVSPNPNSLSTWREQVSSTCTSLQFGTLVSLDGVLNRQGVQHELPSYGVELLLRRIVEADPGEPAPHTADLVDLAGGALRTPVPVHVDGTVDDHASIIRPPP